MLTALVNQQSKSGHESRTLSLFLCRLKPLNYLVDACKRCAGGGTLPVGALVAARMGAARTVGLDPVFASGDEIKYRMCLLSLISHVDFLVAESSDKPGFDRIVTRCDFIQTGL